MFVVDVVVVLTSFLSHGTPTGTGTWYGVHVVPGSTTVFCVIPSGFLELVRLRAPRSLATSELVAITIARARYKESVGEYRTI